MYLLKKEELTELLENSKNHCVSIYLPAHDHNKDIREDSIRLKNLIKKAELQLKNEGCNKDEITNIMQPAHKILEDDAFWRDGGKGVALFLTKDFSKIYKLPETFDELIAVNDKFHLKQMFPYFTMDKRFYILSLSKNKVRLLHCTRYNCEELKHDNLPSSLKDALFFLQDVAFQRDDRVREAIKDKQNLRSGKASATGTVPGVYHGHGGHRELENDRLFQFFRKVDEGVNALLKDDHAPLILASVEEYLPLYKEANTYNTLLDAIVKGNPDVMSNEELHSRAMQTVEPFFFKPIQEAVEKYQNLYGTNNVVHNIKDALTAAYEGRMETLIVAREKEKWGKFDNMTTAVEEHEQQKPGDHDLIDLAALYTLQNDGKVHVVEVEKMPKRMEIAGILRF